VVSTGLFGAVGSHYTATGSRRVSGNAAPSELTFPLRHSIGSSVPERPLFAHLRHRADVSCRRKAALVGREKGRRDWAESAPTRVASGRTGVRAIAVVPLQARMGFAARRDGVCIPTCSVSERAPAQGLAFGADRRAVRMTALIDLIHT
jgi:hypothetical protein